MVHAALRDLGCLDPDDSVAVGLVWPQPSADASDSPVCHLIVHQRATDEVVALVSMVLHGGSHDVLTRRTCVLPEELSLDQAATWLPQALRDLSLVNFSVLQTSQFQATQQDPPVFLRDYESVIVHSDLLEVPDDACSFMATGTRVHNLGPAPPLLIDDERIVARDDATPDPEDLSPEDDGVSSSSDGQPAEPPPRAWYPVTVFSLGQVPGEGQANWLSHNLYRMNIARIMGLRDDEILQLYYVKWPPANIRSAGRQAILVQKRGELPPGSTHKYVLIDVEFHPHRPSTVVEIVRAPYMVPDAFTRSNLLDFLGLTPFCQMSRNRCLVWHNGQLLALQNAAQVFPEHGDFFRVVVPPTPDLLQCVPTRAAARCAQIGIPEDQISQYYIQNDLAADLYDMPVAAPFVDEMALQQTSLRLLRPCPVVCHVEDGSKRDGTPPVEPVDPVLRPWPPPQLPPTDFTIELYHRSHGLLHQTQHTGTFVVTTWYNDHDRWPICADPRDFQPLGAVHLWRSQLLHLWRDRLDPSAPTDIVIVDPDPVDSEPTGAHVLLIQHPHQDARSIVVSVLDSAAPSGAPRGWALRSSIDPSGLEVLALMGYRLLCPPHEPAAQCQVWCRRQEIGHMDVVLVRDGLALTVTVLRAPSIAVEDNQDTSGLVQMSAVTHHEPNGATARCLTHGTVAHTHGPPVASKSGTLVNAPVPALDLPPSFHPPPCCQHMSWTEEFLRAMRAVSTPDETPPPPPDSPAVDLLPWTQRLWPISSNFFMSTFLFLKSTFLMVF